MKNSSVRTLFAVLFCSLGLLANLKAELGSASPSISLSYHDENSAPPHSVALFEIETGLYMGEMVCTDAAGNIYICDPLSELKSELKKFDRQGRLLWSWPLDMGGARNISASVASNGYVWLNIMQPSFSAENSKSFPLVVLQPGNRKPVLDWRKQMSPEVEKALYSSVSLEQWNNMTSQGKSETRTWNIRSFLPMSDKMSVVVSNEGGKNLGYKVESGIVSSPKIRLQLVLSNDGRQLLEAKALKDSNVRSASSNNASWHSELDSPRRPQDWTRLWVWKEGQPKGTPIVTRADLLQPQTSWQRLIGTQPISPPLVFVDAKDNIYLSWRRKSDSPTRRFTVGTTSWLREPMGEDYGQRAVVVLDSNRKFVTSVPWTTCYYELDNWIIPIPDGSGFYRQEFGSKAMEIYWHPLPNFKAAIKVPSKTANSQPKKP